MRHFAASAGPVARVLWARCEPLFTPRPMGPVHELAGAVGCAPADGTPYDEATALLPLLAAKSTAVIFEDVHWADVATLDVIRVLARRIGAVPVLLMLSYRDDELDRSHPLRVVLGDLLGDGQVVRLTPAGLSLQAVARLALTTDVDPGNCTPERPATRSSSPRCWRREPRRWPAGWTRKAARAWREVWPGCR